VRLAWYRPTTPAQLADFCTDANGKQHGTSIPPPLLRPAIIAWIKTQARALVAPQVAETGGAPRRRGVPRSAAFGRRNHTSSPRAVASAVRPA